MSRRQTARRSQPFRASGETHRDQSLRANVPGVPNNDARRIILTYNRELINQADEEIRLPQWLGELLRKLHIKCEEYEQRLASRGRIAQYKEEEFEEQKRQLKRKIATLKAENKCRNDQLDWYKDGSDGESQA